MIVFQSRSFWLELNIPLRLVREKFIHYFGEEEREIGSREDSTKFLLEIINTLQNKMLNIIKTKDTVELLKDLYKILDECYHFYLKQKDARKELKNLNVSNGSINEVFEKNRNISRNIIDSANVWIENCVLYQHITKESNNSNFILDYDLLLDIYVYGISSQMLSLLALSKKFGDKKLFWGLRITPNDDIPIDAIREHPVIYFNTLLTGNQNALTNDIELKDANKTTFGIGFEAEYKVSFLHFLAMMHYIQTNLLYKGKYGLTIIDKEDFINIIEEATNPPISSVTILENFVLSKGKISTQLKNNEKLIWNIGVNRFRNELCPFLLLDNNRVMISYCCLEQSKSLWVSYFQNGGMSYTNCKDNFTRAIEVRNKELSDNLVSILRKELLERYNGTFNEINVKYERIWGKREIDYGDFDLVFYNRKANELFLIEAKYFSDSLNSSSTVTDYEKLFEEDGYYDKCRRRYDLVIKESKPFKEFIGAEGELYVHFLFVSSKPLEIDFQDSDRTVTFLCAEIFGKYLDGKLISDEDESVVRPTFII